MPFDDFKTIEPGDWLFIYNTNASDDGSHSVIFSHWSSDPARLPDGTRYRRAWVYSQPDAARGGRFHEALLGDQHAANPADRYNPITPVTHATWVTPETAPARTPADMIRGGASAASENEKFIQGKEQAFGMAVDRGELLRWLRERNGDFLVAAAHHLTGAQARLIGEAIQGGDLEALVRLYQQLGALAKNVKLLEANVAAENARVKEGYAKAMKARDEAEGKIASIDTGLAGVKSQKDTLDREMAALKADPDVRRLEEAAGALRAQLQDPKLAGQRGQLRAALVERERELIAARQRVAKRVAQVNAELLQLASRRTSFEWQRGQESTKRDAVLAKLPYNLVPGSLAKEDQGSITGRLSEIRPQPDWRMFLIPFSNPAPAAAPPVKKAAPAKK
ncbi:MAG TPA: hypothetical protein VFJ16_06240 [Longimicrobium sp.]|nr:hypothetical protein [Longimicrobium sp.]